MSEEGKPQLPQYVSHKVVGALKISQVVPLRIDGEPVGVLLHFEDGRFKTKELGADYAARIKPGDDAGYYVVYADGYESWSPTKAFVEGYAPYNHSPETQRLDS